MQKDYNVTVIKSSRKTLTLKMKDGKFVLRTPLFFSKSQVEKFISKHTGWMQKQIEKYESKVHLGEEEITELKKKAKLYFSIRVPQLALDHGISYNALRITSAQTRWGSCSSKRNLSFSYRLMLHRPQVRDYVIIHELAHLTHMNHGKNFWGLVEDMMPNYKIYEQELKNIHK